MSAEFGVNVRASTPSTSGRDSPIIRASRHEEGIVKKDKSYRRYASGVERALASFESPQQEWADYISFLGRLLKALQARSAETHTIPESRIVAARLAQCLTPALPPGVHRKAIEVYSFIFETIGKESLANQLHLWFSGLSPVLSFASLAVRPEFLRLLDTYVLPLESQALRAPLRSIILCILPGLEDESSEDHDAWLHLLNKVRVASRATADFEVDNVSHDSYFWQSFFQSTITNPSRRQGALSYLAREMPQFGLLASSGKVESQEQLTVAAEAALTPEPGLLLRCLAAGLSDTQVLVQRGFLDLLVTHLPLHSVVLQKRVPQSDLDLLLLAATGVVARRDMGLNRRLWAWFLGPDAKDEAEASASLDMKSPPVENSLQVAYFTRYGLGALSRSMKGRFGSTSSIPSERARPYKVCLSLMDRWEVGGLLIPQILIPAVQGALDFSVAADSIAANEVIKSASNFFDGVESSLIWATFNRLIEDAFDLSINVQRDRAGKIALCTFIVSRFNIREEEMIVQHIPHSSLFFLAQLRRFYETDDRVHQYAEMLTDSMTVLEKLMVSIPARAYAGPQKASDLVKQREIGAKTSLEDILRRMKHFYIDQHGGANGAPLPFPATDIGTHMIRQAISLLLRLYASPLSASLDSLSRIILGLISTVPRASLALQQSNVLEHFTLILQKAGTGTISFRILSSMTSILYGIQTSPDFLPMAIGQSDNIEALLVEHLWYYLCPHNPEHHVETVRCIWQIESIDPARKLVEAVISTLLSRELAIRSRRHPSAPMDAARRFTGLWTHSVQERPVAQEKPHKGVLRKPSNLFPSLAQFSSPIDPSNVLTRPLLLLLDSLLDAETEVSLYVKCWLQELASLSKVFSIVVDEIQSLQCMKEPKLDQISLPQNHDDAHECLYFFRLLLEMARNSSEQLWLTLAADLADQASHNTVTPSTSTLQTIILKLALDALNLPVHPSEHDDDCRPTLQRTVLELTTELLNGTYARALVELRIYEPLLQRLYEKVGVMDSLQQMVILQTIAAALKLGFAHTAESTMAFPLARRVSRDMASMTASRTSLVKDSSANNNGHPQGKSPALLIECLKLGFESESSHLAIDHWVNFLIEVLPLFPDSIFQHIIPLVECLCKQIAIVFDRIRLVFKQYSHERENVREPTLIGLLNALEHILANSHHLLLKEDGQVQISKITDPPQGFFGNMVQGVFAGEHEKAGRSAVANSRLTVLLCFQDAVRICFRIWSWGSASSEKPDGTSLASYAYTTMRMRNRARRLLEHLFAAEALECMETLATIWCKPAHVDCEPTSVFGLLNVLSGSKPKHTIPAIFNAVYSRTNPGALEQNRLSSLTSELQDLDLVAFLIDYTKTLDDDAMDEIWIDCVAFLKDVLANPLPHSQILPPLMLFATLLAEKVNNTNFGEQRKLRRELGDLFLRILTATFTTRPMGFLQEPSASSAGQQMTNGHKLKRVPDVLATLKSVIPQLKLVLGENDRVQNAINSITANVTGPTLRAKAFPSNIDSGFLEVLGQLTRLPQASRLWKKDVADGLSDARFFSMPFPLVKDHWLHILRNFIHNDKDRMPEILSRLTAPATAGLVFGVGATSARQDADRRAQLNLRRIALLVLASPGDTFAKNTGLILEKLSELCSATPTTSPSSATLADVYILLRALLIRSSPAHLAPLWPLINSELQSSLSAVLSQSSSPSDRHSNATILQGAKLLDLLTTLNQDDFQLHAWLFVTDSIDAIHRPIDGRVPPIALVDAVADSLADQAVASSENYSPGELPSNINIDAYGRKLRRPVLDGMLNTLSMDMADLRAVPRQDLSSRLLKPFFGQLSLMCYEATYAMLEPDIQFCEDAILRDIFEDGVVS